MSKRKQPTTGESDDDSYPPPVLVRNGMGDSTDYNWIWERRPGDTDGKFDPQYANLITKIRNGETIDGFQYGDEVREGLLRELNEAKNNLKTHFNNDVMSIFEKYVMRNVEES